MYEIHQVSLDKMRRALKGVAIGDSLGSPHEFRYPINPTLCIKLMNLS